MFYTVRGAAEVLVSCHLGFKEYGNELLPVIFCGYEHLERSPNFVVVGISFAGEQHPLGGAFEREI